MKKLTLVPDGWPCTLEDCPPGPFLFKNTLCFKSEYRSPKGKVDAYNEAGEYFHGEGPVQPLKAIWEENDL